MQERKGILKLNNVNENILSAIKYTGFDKFLIIENNPVNADEKGSKEE